MPGMFVAKAGVMRLVFSCLLVLVTGCGTIASDGSDADYRSAVLQRASAEFGCPSNEITLTYIDHSTYVATGCGYTATYVCDLQMPTAGTSVCQRDPSLERGDAGSS